MENFGHFYFVHQVSSLLEPSDVTNMINRLCVHRKKIQVKKTDEPNESNISSETKIDIEGNSSIDYNMNERCNKESQTQPFMIVSEV